MVEAASFLRPDLFWDSALNDRKQVSDSLLTQFNASRVGRVAAELQRLALIRGLRLFRLPRL